MMNGPKGGLFHSPSPALFIRVESAVLCGGQGVDRNLPAGLNPVLIGALCFQVGESQARQKLRPVLWCLLGAFVYKGCRECAE